MIYKGNKETLRAREDVLARLYRCLRITNEDEPLKDQSLQLFEQIKAALIEATREIYEKQIKEARKEEARATDEKD